MEAWEARLNLTSPHISHLWEAFINTGALARCLSSSERQKLVTTVSAYVFSASECREAYGVRAACCRFRTFLKFPSSLDWRKRQQAARTPYASRHSDVLNTYSTVCHTSREAVETGYFTLTAGSLSNTGALARCLRAWRQPSGFNGLSRSVTNC